MRKCQFLCLFFYITIRVIKTKPSSFNVTVWNKDTFLFQIIAWIKNKQTKQEVKLLRNFYSNQRSSNFPLSFILKILIVFHPLFFWYANFSSCLEIETNFLWNKICFPKCKFCKRPINVRFSIGVREEYFINIWLSFAVTWLISRAVLEQLRRKQCNFQTWCPSESAPQTALTRNTTHGKLF